MLNVKRSKPPNAVVRTALAAALLTWSGGCGRAVAVSTRHEPVVLHIGFGLSGTATPKQGLRRTVTNLAVEGLTSLSRDGRSQPLLADSWTTSADGLTWRVHLRPDLTFHSGKPADADAIRRILVAQLPDVMGPAYDDIADIRTLSPREIEFSLRRRSSMLMEDLGDADIQEDGPALSATGPFSVADEQPGEILLRANERYHGGKPTVDRVLVKPYGSVRSAWAEMLRGQVDVLYDVGIDALDSLESSNDIGVFAFQRGYAYMLLLNVQRPELRDPAFRRQLNMAIDRQALIAEGLRGHGTPATGPVWLNHWAYSGDLPQFAYRPQPITGSRRITLKCLLPEPSLERLALVLQRQLQAIGVDLELELVSLEQFAARVASGRGDFDAVITDAQQGPNLGRPYKWWHSGAPANFGHFSSARVDAALDSIRQAPDETAYRAGVAAFQGAMIDDPPAVFLVWRERARAVSRRFVVPSDPKNDVLLSIRLWRPSDSTVASTN